MRDEDLYLDAFLIEETKRVEATNQASAESARFDAWLAKQSDTFRALYDEMLAIQRSRGMRLGIKVSIRRDERGTLLFVVGGHTSEVSHEAALKSMVECYRTRVEDLESTYMRFNDLLDLADIEKNKSQMRLAATTRSSAVSLDDTQLDQIVRRKMCIRACQDLGRRVRQENPGMAGPECDQLILTTITNFENAKRLRD